VLPKSSLAAPADAGEAWLHLQMQFPYFFTIIQVGSYISLIFCVQSVEPKDSPLFQCGLIGSPIV
jgi:hypothetical protein